MAYQVLLGRPGCQPQDVYYYCVKHIRGETAAYKGLVPTKHEAKTATPVLQPLGRAHTKPYVNEWQ